MTTHQGRPYTWPCSDFLQRAVYLVLTAQVHTLVVCVGWAFLGFLRRSWRTATAKPWGPREFGSNAERRNVRKKS